MTAQLDSFETALLKELREHVDQQNAVPPRAPQRRQILLTAAALAVVAGGLGVVVPQLGTEAAYSVQEGNAGTINVEVRRPEDAAGLEAALAQYGIKADVMYVAGGQQCAPGRYTPVDRRLSGMQVTIGSEQLQVTLPPGTVQQGETFVMAISHEAIAPETEQDEEGDWILDGYKGWTSFDVTAGSVQPCEVVPITD